MAIRGVKKKRPFGESFELQPQERVYFEHLLYPSRYPCPHKCGYDLDFKELEETDGACPKCNKSVGDLNDLDEPHPGGWLAPRDFWPAIPRTKCWSLGQRFKDRNVAETRIIKFKDKRGKTQSTPRLVRARSDIEGFRMVYLTATANGLIPLLYDSEFYQSYALGARSEWYNRLNQSLLLGSSPIAEEVSWDEFGAASTFEDFERLNPDVFATFLKYYTPRGYAAMRELQYNLFHRENEDGTASVRFNDTTKCQSFIISAMAYVSLLLEAFRHPEASTLPANDLRFRSFLNHIYDLDPEWVHPKQHKEDKNVKGKKEPHLKIKKMRGSGNEVIAIGFGTPGQAYFMAVSTS